METPARSLGRNIQKFSPFSEEVKITSSEGGQGAGAGFTMNFIAGPRTTR